MSMSNNSDHSFHNVASAEAYNAMCI